MQDNYEILLGSAQSKESTNQDAFLNIRLEGNQHTIEETDIQSTLDLNEQYIKERDTCTKYRLTVTINPICTNVLCNPTSTIINPKGNGELYVNNSLETVMTKWIYNPLDVNPSTHQSPETPVELDFHVGYDIFDNVYFRTTSIRRGRFMDDVVEMETAEGKQYQYAFIKDTINGYSQAIETNLTESEGWIQCANPSRLMTWKMKEDNTGYELEDSAKIPYTINGNCEKTDLFPTRKMLLFNTICEYNSQKRLINEENWSYFISYPYKNEHFHWLTHTPEADGMAATQGIPIVYVEEFGDESADNIFNKPCLKITTAYSNKFQVFNKIRIYTDNMDYDFIIQKVVDDKTFYVLLHSNLPISFKKNSRIRRIVNNMPCEYYMRIFRKVPNWKYEDEKITHENIDKKLQTNKQLFSSIKYNLGYSKNYFNDKMVQISFTDSVDTNLLKDNIGRPVSKIYFSVYKNNESTIDWKYAVNNKNKNFNPSSDSNMYSTDFQRYWSKNSAGFELVHLDKDCVTLKEIEEYQKNYPNIFCIHNINNNRDVTGTTSSFPMNITVNYKSHGDLKCGSQVPTDDFIFPYSPDGIGNENRIEDRNTVLYYGDIVEFDKSNFMETVLSKCQHRFNTVNRESDLFHDTVIVTHSIGTFNTDNIVKAEKAAQSLYNPRTGTGTMYDAENEISFWGNRKDANDCDTGGDDAKCIWRGVMKAGPRPEGYYHQAHYPVSLKWYEKRLQYKSFPRVYLDSDIFKDVEYKTESCNTDSGEVEFLPFFTYSAHNLLQNAIIKMMWTYHAIDYEKAFIITTTKKDDRKFLVPFDRDLWDYITKNNGSNAASNISKITTYQYDYDTPEWSRHIGYGRFVWRNIMSPDDATSNGYEEYPFTNGNLYIHKQINFFLRRQSIGCPDMLFNRFPSDVSPSRSNIRNEIYEEITEIC
jgi:hypothetical protein